MHFHCPKLIKNLVAVLIWERYKNCIAETAKIIPFRRAIWFFFCSLTTNKLDDNSEWRSGGGKREGKIISRGKKYKLKWYLAEDEWFNFFELPAKFTRIIVGQTNECTKCWQMVYGSINIDERHFKFILAIERLNSKAKCKRESEWKRNDRKGSHSVFFRLLIMHCFTHCVYVLYPALSLSLSLAVDLYGVVTGHFDLLWANL